MRNKLLSCCLLVWMLTAFALTASAQSFDYSQKGSLSVTLVSTKTEQPMAGAELSVFHVATVGINTDGKLNYIYTEDFAQCGVPLDDPALVTKLNAFLSEHSLPSQTVVTDHQGKAVCSELPLGLYFVKQSREVEGFALCSPFLVTIPMETDSGYQYHVDASPKTDVVRLAEITIKKVWNNGNSTKIPESITVQLLRDGEVVETAILNAQNNWQITYKNLPESDGYSIKEVNVPQGFTATYAKNGYVFTVTNTPSLAQTGQVVWPIPVFALAGIVFLMIGFAILRKSGKENG